MQPPHLSRGWQVLLSLGLLALVLGVFWPALHNGFVGYDDPDYVTGNWHVQQGLTWQGIKWAFTTYEAANWHPLTWLSHQLDAQVFGARAWGHHLTSIGLHALNGVLVFVVLRTLTGATWRSWLVAMLFALHPLRVESATWVSERKDVLSGFFFLLTLWAWSKRNAAPKARGVGTSGTLETGGPESALQTSRGMFLLALLFYALGLMSKPMLVTLPFVLLLLDFWPLGRLAAHSRLQWRVALVEKLPFLGAAVAAAVVTVFAQDRGGAMVENVPLPARLANAVVAYARYIGKLFWPTDLSPFYPPVLHWPVFAVLASTMLLMAVFTLAFITRHRAPYLVVGWLWFIGMLVPVIGLVPVGEQSMADRYSYLPSIGLLVLLVWSIHRVTVRYFSLRVAATALVLCLVPSAALTRKQIGIWRDTETLFAHALRVNPGNYLALNNLGTAADQAGRNQEAIAWFRQALRARPGYAHAHNNLGAVLLETGKVTEALEQFQLALHSAPGYAEAHNNLGSVLERQGRVDEAINHFVQACRLNPSHGDAHYNLGLQLIRKNRFAEAIPHLEVAIRLAPASADAWNNLGFALQQLKQSEAAIAAYLRAIKLRPDYARAHFNVGVALYELGRIDAAIEEFRTALKINPDYLQAQKNLKALLELKR